MPNETPYKSDLQLINAYFFAGCKAAQVAKEVKALTADERAQLASGIRDGSFTYA